MASIMLTFTGVWNAADLGIGTVSRTVDARNNLLAVDGLLWGLMNGTYTGTYDVVTSATNAAKSGGTITITAGTGAVGANIGGTLVTVTWATSDAASATALATAINANATVNKALSAAAVSNVVTLTPYVPGPTANLITLVASGTGVTVSGATLTGGTGVDSAPTTYRLA